MNSQLHPPAGVAAHLAGLPVLAAQANAALSSSGRRLLTLLAGLLAVGLVLLAVFRSLERTLVPLIPIALATGWSALILFADRDPAEPDVGNTRRAGDRDLDRVQRAPLRALPPGARAPGTISPPRSRARTAPPARPCSPPASPRSPALACWCFSSITMLRDFGFVTLVDLSVSLGGVLLLLPAVLAVAERGRARGDAARSGAARRALLPRLRRRRADRVSEPTSGPPRTEPAPPVPEHRLDPRARGRRGVRRRRPAAARR